MSKPAPVRHHRFTVQDYFRMGEVGILNEDDRVELLEGEIVELSPIGNVHASVVSRLTALFVPAAATHAIVRVQDPAILSRFSAPQPDIAVVAFRQDFYVDAHPGPDDTLLIVEVADSSVRIDLGFKARLYASARVPEYWVVDISRQRIVAHTQPEDQGYGSVRTLSPGEELSTPALPGGSWPVNEILGRTSPV
ncbi:MAG: Uma2 family endonuclease [Planctomycetaceae bacterium]